MADAKIVTIANQKGGTGKTTTTMTLAAGLSGRGFDVLVVDADPQGTATRWAASAPDGRPFPATVINLAAAQKNLHKMVKEHMRSYDVILIDCPPNVDSPSTQSALLISDLALVPVIPRPSELWALERLFVLMKEMKDIPGRLLPVMLQNNTVITDTLELLGESPLPLMKSAFSQRVGFTRSMVLGGTCYGSGDKVAVEEAEHLTSEVLSLVGLAKRNKKPALKSA